MEHRATIKESIKRRGVDLADRSYTNIDAVTTELIGLTAVALVGQCHHHITHVALNVLLVLEDFRSAP